MANFGTVLIAGGNLDDLESRQAALADAGYVVETAASGADFLHKAESMRPTVALLGNNLADADPHELTRKVKNGAATAALPVMLMNTAANGEAREVALSSGADDYVEDGILDSVLIRRMQPLLRLATMANELHDRQATASEFGVNAGPEPVPANIEDCQVMVVAAGEDMADTVRKAAADGTTITHETNPYVAGDMLERSRYNAAVIVMDGTLDAERLLYLCTHIRNNPRLFNLPILALLKPGLATGDTELYAAGASIVHELPVASASLGLAIDLLVRRQRRRWQLRDAIAHTLTSATSGRLRGIYSSEFLRAHLARLIASRETSARSLAVIVLAIGNAPAIADRFGDEAATLLMQQMADFITGLVRIEDLCARISDIRFCVVLPDATAKQAEQVIHRISAVLGHAEFHLGEEVCAPVGVWVQAGRAILTPGKSAYDLVGHALADIM